MLKDPALGDFVTHETLGTGKVVFTDGDIVRVYFKDSLEPTATKRVRQFKAPCLRLTVVAAFDDAELDNLPPWKDDRFDGAKHAVNLEDAKRTFLRFFPEGLDDPVFIRKEKQYKASASRRFDALVRSDIRPWIETSDHAAIAAGLDAVYGDPKASKDGPDTRLNVLYQKVEEPAYFDALRSGGELTTRYAEAAIDFIDSSSQANFDRYLSALRQLPTRKGGASIDLWTTVTWLPFIAAPDRHFLIKPTIVQAFASALPFDIQYKSDINFRTYSRCVAMANRLGEILERSEVNLKNRALDMLDVQSFMWVVERWTAKDAIA